MAEINLSIKLSDKGVVQGISQVENATTKLDKKAKSSTGGVSTNFSKMTTSVGSSIKNTISSVTKLTGVIGGLSVGVAVHAIDDLVTRFETGMGAVSTLVDTTTIDMGQLSDGIRQLAIDTGQPLDALQKALFDTISAGVPAGDAIKFLGTAGQLAVGGVTDISTATTGLIAVTKAYGLEASDVTRLSDELFAAQKGGITTIQELSQSIGQVAPVARQAGLSTSELTGALSDLTVGLGGDTAMAATQLRGLLVALAKPTKELTDLAEQHGYASAEQMLAVAGLTKTIQYMTDAANGSNEVMLKFIPRIEGATGAMILGRDGAKGLTESLERTAQSAGATQEAFDKMSERIKFQKDQAMAKFRDILLEIGERALPDVSVALSNLSSWLDENRDTVIDTVESGWKEFQVVLISVSDGARAAWPLIKGLGETVAVFGKSLIDSYNKMPDAVKSAGFISLLLFGPKGAIAAAGIIHTIDAIGNSIAGLREVASGKISPLDFATANFEELERLLEEVKVKEDAMGVASENLAGSVDDLVTGAINDSILGLQNHQEATDLAGESLLHFNTALESVGQTGKSVSLSAVTKEMKAFNKEYDKLILSRYDYEMKQLQAWEKAQKKAGVDRVKLAKAVSIQEQKIYEDVYAEQIKSLIDFYNQEQIESKGWIKYVKQQANTELETYKNLNLDKETETGIYNDTIIRMTEAHVKDLSIQDADAYRNWAYQQELRPDELQRVNTIVEQVYRDHWQSLSDSDQLRHLQDIINNPNTDPDELRKALTDIKKLHLDTWTAIEVGWKEAMLTDFPTTTQVWVQLGKDAATDLRAGIKGTFVDVFKGDIEDISDVWDATWDAMKDHAIDALAEIATNKAIEFGTNVIDWVFHTGGVAPDEGVALVQQGETILTKLQSKALDKFFQQFTEGSLLGEGTTFLDSLQWELHKIIPSVPTPGEESFAEIFQSLKESITGGGTFFARGTSVLDFLQWELHKVAPELVSAPGAEAGTLSPLGAAGLTAAWFTAGYAIGEAVDRANKLSDARIKNAAILNREIGLGSLPLTGYSYGGLDATDYTGDHTQRIEIVSQSIFDNKFNSGSATPLSQAISTADLSIVRGAETQLNRYSQAARDSAFGSIFSIYSPINMATELYNAMARLPQVDNAHMWSPKDAFDLQISWYTDLVEKTFSPLNTFLKDYDAGGATAPRGLRGPAVFEYLRKAGQPLYGLSDVAAGIEYRNMGGTPPAYVTTQTRYQKIIDDPSLYGYKTDTFGNLIPAFEQGLAYVPYDEFPALLHEGERVLTKQENTSGNEAEKEAVRVLRAIYERLGNQKPVVVYSDGRVNRDAVEDILRQIQREELRVS